MYNWHDRIGSTDKALLERRRNVEFSPERLRQCRREAGLTQEECARAVGVSTSTYHNLEHARQIPNVKVLSQMVDTFDCRLDDLFA